VAAFVGFTLPSALLMGLAAAGVTILPAAAAPAVQGALVAVLAIVAHAVWGLWSRLCPDRSRQAVALLAAAALLLMPGALGQLAVLLVASLVGAVALPALATTELRPLAPAWRGRHGALALLVCAGAGQGLWLAASGTGGAIVPASLQAGGLVFGGGHVVLPLLERTVVPEPLPTPVFLTGYAAAQVMPGPLFTFATYLGQAAGGPLTALLATLAIFLPGTAALLFALPLWSAIRRQQSLRRALAGVNAAVVGLLLCALVQPLAPATLRAGEAGLRDLALATALFAGLLCLRLPGWAAALLGAAVGWAGWS
jgi:chromate transporter